MKKLGYLAVLLSAVGFASIGCEPAKKKEEAPKAPAADTPAPAAAPEGDAK